MDFYYYQAITVHSIQHNTIPLTRRGNISHTFRWLACCCGVSFRLLARHGFTCPNCFHSSKWMMIFEHRSSLDSFSTFFPSFRSRGIASSLAAALNYVFGFITKKIYFSLETTLSLPGTALFYCLICGIGLIFMYNVLPETENRSLEEIELHFADNAKTLCDRNIRKKSDVFADNNDMLLQENEAKLAFLSWL